MAPSESKYYAVFKGRVDSPTIFSSWADAHPRVIGYSESEHDSFKTLEEAREYMKKRNTRFTEVIKKGSGEASPIRNSKVFYAIAYGERSGVYRSWDEAKLVVDGFPENCYKRFETRHEADAFIEDWKQSFADAYRWEIKKALDQGFRPHDMKFSVQGILHETKTEVERPDVLDKFDKLNIGN